MTDVDGDDVQGRVKVSWHQNIDCQILGTGFSVVYDTGSLILSNFLSLSV